MSEVLESKSKKKSTLSNEEGKVKNANSSKSKELNIEKTKTGNKTSNKTQSVEKEKGNVTVKGTAKKTVKESTKQTQTGKISTVKEKIDKASSNKSSVSANKSKISTNKVSTNKTKQESKTNLNAKTENDKLKKVAEKPKIESKTTNSQKQKSNTNQKNKTTKKETASKEISKKDIDEKETLKNQKSNNGTTKKENVKDEKTETNNLPAPESKFDTVSLKEIREALQNKVNDNQKQKVVKKVLINIGFAITMIVYLIIVALATKNIELSVLEKDLKIITLGILVSGLGVLERAYKKDNTQMAINAVEILVFGAINLCMIYAIKINFIKLGDFKDTINNITYIGSAVAVYYIIKSIIIAIKNVKKYKKENNDIKEIIKK